MKYLTVEIQTMGSGQVAAITTAHDTRELAESAYHTALAAAAISELPSHACVLLDAEGGVLDRRCYTHGAESGES